MPESNQAGVQATPVKWSRTAGSVTKGGRDGDSEEDIDEEVSEQGIHESGGKEGSRQKGDEEGIREKGGLHAQAH